MTDPRLDDAHQLRVVVADDDPFTVSLVGDGLRAKGFGVFSASTAQEAAALVNEVDAHALVTDLNFGEGMTGASLLRLVRERSPWVALIILTSHQSPELAVDDPSDIPADTAYLVKSQVTSVDQLADAVTGAIEGHPDDVGTIQPGAIMVTGGQAEVLRLLAAGSSTRAIAEKRGTTVRAAEAMVMRLYATLGLPVEEQFAPRVAAIRLWQQGRIRVR